MEDSSLSDWYFIPKTVVNGMFDSRNQREILESCARELGFAEGKWHQTHPALRFFVLVSNYQNNGERLMQYVFEQSDGVTPRAYTGLISVGYFGPDGVLLTGSVNKAFRNTGVSLTR